MLIRFHITEFHLENRYDYITFGNGEAFRQSIVGSLTGSVKVSSLRSSEAIFWMILSTDNTGNLAGFRFVVEQILKAGIDVGKWCDRSGYRG